MRNKGVSDPFPIARGSLRPFSHHKRGNLAHPQIPLAKIPLAQRIAHRVGFDVLSAVSGCLILEIGHISLHPSAVSVVCISAFLCRSFTCLPVSLHPSSPLSVRLSVHLGIPSVPLSVCPARLYARLSFCLLSVCLSVCLSSADLSVCQSSCLSTLHLL